MSHTVWPLVPRQQAGRRQARSQPGRPLRQSPERGLSLGPLLAAVRIGGTVDGGAASHTLAAPGHSLVEAVEVEERFRDLTEALVNAELMAESCRADVLPNEFVAPPSSVEPFGAVCHFPIPETQADRHLVRLGREAIGRASLAGIPDPGQAREGVKAMPRALALQEAKGRLRQLPRADAGKLVAGLTGGVLRGSEQEVPPIVLKSKKPALPAGDRPYAHTFYWAAFMLIGDPQ